jgi:hypothetical protein
MGRRLTGIQRRGDKWRAAVRVNGKLYVSPWGREPSPPWLVQRRIGAAERPFEWGTAAEIRLTSRIVS